MAENNYYSIEIDKLYEIYGSSSSGLTNKQIELNKKKYGKNILDEKKTKSKARVFLEQFQDILVIILIISAIISLFTGGLESTIVIFFVISLNATLGTIQYFKAEKSLKSLKSLSSSITKVIRNGMEEKVASDDITVGDIVILDTGDVVSADIRLIKTINLQINESSLTGEALSVEKNANIIIKKDLPLAEQKNMVFSGSLVTEGRGLGIVVNVGMTSEIGKIARALKETKQDKTPLQNSLDEFSKHLAIIIIVICLTVFGLSLYRNIKLFDALMFAVALAVAAIPEALSSIVTIVLAIGTQKMVTENAIVKELKAVEGLGSITVICTDKTGTITQNKMSVREVFINKEVKMLDAIDKNKKISKMFYGACVLCNNASLKTKDKVSTEDALLKVYGGDIKHYRNVNKRISEVPFDSNRKIMSTLNFFEGKNILFVKGANDVLINRCSYIINNEEIRKITSNDIFDIKKTSKSMSERGMRVIALCYKEMYGRRSISYKDEYELIFIGLVGLIDPPKEEAKQAISDTYIAGIKPVMITGDNKITALSIAKEVGIFKEGDLVLTGTELKKMTDEELDKNIFDASVYARVTPSDKIRIVSSWQRNNQIVAFVGDGVNDAPAIKKANIGISMGKNGTEVSKDASSIILIDDNYSTIIKAVRNGRNIYDNIQNAIRFLISGNAAAILAVIYTSLLALPIPFAPVHLLFINLLTDSLPAIAIGMEDAKADLLKQKPRKPKESLISKKVLVKIVLEGLLISFFTILSYHIGLSTNQYAARTCVFLTLCSARLFHSFNCRSRYSIFTDKVKNKMMYLSFILGIILLNLVIFVPFLQPIFKVWELTKEQIIKCYIFSISPTIIIQLALLIKEKVFRKG